MIGNNQDKSKKGSEMIMQIHPEIFSWSVYELHRIKKLQTIQEAIENWKAEDIADIQNQLGRMSCFLYKLSKDAGTLQNIYHELKKPENKRYLDKTIVYLKHLEKLMSIGSTEYYFPQDVKNKPTALSHNPMADGFVRKYNNNFVDLLYPGRNIFNDKIITYLLHEGNVTPKIHPILRYLSNNPASWNNLKIFNFFIDSKDGIELNLKWQEHFVQHISHPYFYNIHDTLPDPFNKRSLNPLDLKTEVTEYKEEKYILKHKDYPREQWFLPQMKAERVRFADEFLIPTPSYFWYDRRGYEISSMEAKKACLHYLKFTTDALTIAAEFWFSDKSSDEQINYLNQENQLQICAEDISEWPVSWFNYDLMEGISTACERIKIIQEILSRDSLTDSERLNYTLCMGDSLWLIGDTDGSLFHYQNAHRLLSNYLYDEGFIHQLSEGRCQWHQPTFWEEMIDSGQIIRCPIEDLFDQMEQAFLFGGGLQFKKSERLTHYSLDDFQEIITIKRCLSEGYEEQAKNKMILLIKSLPGRTLYAKAVILQHLYILFEEGIVDNRYTEFLKKCLNSLESTIHQNLCEEINDEMRYYDPKRRSDVFQFRNKFEKSKILLESGSKNYRSGIAEAGRCLYHLSMDKMSDCERICLEFEQVIEDNEEYSSNEIPWSEAYVYLCRIITGNIDSERDIFKNRIKKWWSFNNIDNTDNTKRQQLIGLLEFIEVEVTKEKPDSMEEALFPLFDAIMEFIDNGTQMIVDSCINSSIIPLCQKWFEYRIESSRNTEPEAIKHSEASVILDALNYSNKKDLDCWLSTKRQLHFGYAYLKERIGDKTAIEEYQNSMNVKNNWCEHAKQILQQQMNTSDQERKFLISKGLSAVTNYNKTDIEIYEKMGLLYQNNLDLEMAWECFEKVTRVRDYNDVNQHLVTLDRYLEDHVRVESIKGCPDAKLSFKTADIEFFNVKYEYSDDNYDYSGILFKYAKGLESLLDEHIWSDVVNKFRNDQRNKDIKDLWWIAPSLIPGKNRKTFSLGSWARLIKIRELSEQRTDDKPDLIGDILHYLLKNFGLDCLSQIQDICSDISDLRNYIAHGGVLNKTELNEIRNPLIIKLNELIHLLWGEGFVTKRWQNSIKDCDLLYSLGLFCEHNKQLHSALKYYNKFLKIIPWDDIVLTRKEEVCRDLADEAKVNQKNQLYKDFMEEAVATSNIIKRYSHIDKKMRGDFQRSLITGDYYKAKDILNRLNKDPIVVADGLNSALCEFDENCKAKLRNANRRLKEVGDLLNNEPDDINLLYENIILLYQIGSEGKAKSKLESLCDHKKVEDLIFEFYRAGAILSDLEFASSRTKIDEYFNQRATDDII